MTEQPFPDSQYAEAVRESDPSELTKNAMEFLAEQGDLGKEYFEEAIHQEGVDYFDRLGFESVEDVRRDFEIYAEGVQESQ